ncbi:hypothetical protein [Actinomadura atramentaria]|uniref:hypothetical protein n=1 Tax=Actinomadura atramentaria TaxID=1990 RepID=UPI000380B03D|nr:hypothetical protein [Actinomadura atramentaria]
MRLYFTGGEVPGWRKLLHSRGAHDIELSYHGMRRRRVTPARINEHHPTDLPDGATESVLLNSGGFSFNKNEEDYSREQLLEIAADYVTYVSDNLDDLDLFIEFDAARLGPDWINAQRRQVWDHIAPDKLVVVWRAEDGLGELQRLCDTYSNVAITQTALTSEQGAMDITPHLPRIVDTTGVRLHGSGITRPEVIERVPFASVSSTSWLSPSHYGDTIIWANGQLKRYPKKYKDRSRTRHRQIFIDAGLDAEAICADDSTEVLKLSIWSWLAWRDHLNAGQGVTRPWNEGSALNTENTPQAVDTPPDQMRNSQLPLVGDFPAPPAAHPIARRPAPRNRERRMLPVAAIEHVTDTAVDVDGNTTSHTRTELRSVGESLRACDSCFLAARGCPGFEPGAACVYEFPAQIREARQELAAAYTLLEMQLQRIAIGKMAEDLAGGYPDANLSAEMDRYMRMAKAVREREQTGVSLKIEAHGDAPAAGIFSRIFSPAAAQQAGQLERPRATDDVLHQVLQGETAV